MNSQSPPKGVTVPYTPIKALNVGGGVRLSDTYHDANGWPGGVGDDHNDDRYNVYDAIDKDNAHDDGDDDDVNDEDDEEDHDDDATFRCILCRPSSQPTHKQLFPTIQPLCSPR